MFGLFLLLTLLTSAAIALIVATLRVPTQRRSNGSYSVSYSLVDPDTERRLQRMVQDRAAVDRLIALTRKNYPGQPEQWIWEKAISQLERDRRY